MSLDPMTRRTLMGGIQALWNRFSSGGSTVSKALRHVTLPAFGLAASAPVIGYELDKHRAAQQQPLDAPTKIASLASIGVEIQRAKNQAPKRTGDKPTLSFQESDTSDSKPVTAEADTIQSGS